MERPAKPELIVLHLTPPSRDTSDEAWRRLRAALKGLWRSYGLKCIKATVDDATVTREGIEQ